MMPAKDNYIRNNIRNYCEKVEYMKYQFLLIEFAISKSSNHFDIKTEINEEKSGIVDRIIGNVINYIVFEIK